MAAFPNRIRFAYFFAALFIWFCAVPVLRAEEEETWNTCSTPKTQYVLQVPASLIHSTAPAATGCAFQTPGGEFNVEAVVQDSSTDENIDQRMQKEMDLLAQTVTYKKKEDTWFVLSGVTPDGTEYYRKLFTNGAQWVTLRITYPHVRNKKYDKWVTRIEKTFVPFAKAAEANGESARPSASPESRTDADGD